MRSLLACERRSPTLLVDCGDHCPTASCRARIELGHLTEIRPRVIAIVRTILGRVVVGPHLVIAASEFRFGSRCEGKRHEGNLVCWDEPNDVVVALVETAASKDRQ